MADYQRDIFVVFVWLLSVCLCDVNSTNGTALFCKDSDTGKYHAANTSWSSKTFCGNYFCKVRRKNTTDNELILGDVTQDSYDARLDDLEILENNANEGMASNTENKNSNNTLCGLFQECTDNNTTEDEDRYLNAEEVNVISKLLYSVKKSDLHALVEIYNLANDIYTEMETSATETKAEVVSNRMEPQEVKQVPANNYYSYPSTVPISYWYNPSTLYAQYPRNEQINVNPTTPKTIVPYSHVVKPIVVNTIAPRLYSLQPNVKQVDANRPNVYGYPHASFQSVSTYLNNANPPVRQNVVPPAVLSSLSYNPSLDVPDCPYHAAQRHTIQSGVSQKQHNIVSPQIQVQIPLMNSPVNNMPSRSVLDPNPLQRQNIPAAPSPTFPLTYIYQYNQTSNPFGVPYAGAKAQWPHFQLVNAGTKYKKSVNIPIFGRFQDASSVYGQSKIAPTNPIKPNSLQNQLPQAVNSNPFNLLDTPSLYPNDSPNSESYDNKKIGGGWRSDPLSTEILEDVRANVLQRSNRLLNKHLSRRNRIKLEKVGKVIRLDELKRVRRALTEADEKKQEDEEFETYVDNIECELATEPGYFRAGDLALPFPACCPQRIERR